MDKHRIPHVDYLGLIAAERNKDRQRTADVHTKRLVWLMAAMLGTLAVFGVLGAAFMAQELTR